MAGESESICRANTMELNRRRRKGNSKSIAWAAVPGLALLRYCAMRCCWCSIQQPDHWYDCIEHTSEKESFIHVSVVKEHQYRVRLETVKEWAEKRRSSWLLCDQGCKPDDERFPGKRDPKITPSFRSSNKYQSKTKVTPPRVTWSTWPAKDALNYAIILTEARKHTRSCWSEVWNQWSEWYQSHVVDCMKRRPFLALPPIWYPSSIPSALTILDTLTAPICLHIESYLQQPIEDPSWRHRMGLARSTVQHPYSENWSKTPYRSWRASSNSSEPRLWNNTARLSTARSIFLWWTGGPTSIGLQSR